MPFESTTELPEEVRDALDDEELEQFLSVVNERLEAGDGESEAFRKAWGVVREGAASEIPTPNASQLDVDSLNAWWATFERVRRRHNRVKGEDVRRHASVVASAFVRHEETSQGVELDNVSKEGRRLERLMDREERGLAETLRSIAIDYKRDFRRFIRDNPRATSNEIGSRLDRLRDRYIPKFRSAIQDRVETIRGQAQEITLDENDVLSELVDPSNLPNPELSVRRNASFEESLTILVDDLARELLNRSEAAAVDSHRENERQKDSDGNEQRRKIDRPADSTIDGVATQVGSSSVTEGRDDVATEAQDATEETVYAIRTSVLDQNTCDRCAELDSKRVEVGSKAYNLYAPPAFCEGGSRCRCYYEIAVGRGTSNWALRGDGVAVEHATFSPDEGQWHLLYPWGEKEHRKGNYTVDKAFAAKMQQAFEYMRERHGDHPPIWRNHEDSGFVWGEVTDIRVTSRGIEGRIKFNGLAEPYVENNAIDRLSPTHIEEWRDPETGELLENMLFEVSFVTREHLKSLPTVSESRASRPRTPNSFQRIQQEAQMPPVENAEGKWRILVTDLRELIAEKTDESTSEADVRGRIESEVPRSPSTVSDIITGDIKRPDNDVTRAIARALDADIEDFAEEVGTENADETDNDHGDAMHTFGDALDKMLDKASTPEDMPGMSRMEHLERIATGAMSAEDLSQRIEEGALVYPSDDLLESVAEWLNVELSALRRGEVKRFGAGDKGGEGGKGDAGPAGEAEESSSEPEGGEKIPRPGAGTPNAADEQVEQLRRENARLRCENAGLGNRETKRILDAYENGDTLEAALDVIQNADQPPSSDENPSPTSEAEDRPSIGTERGEVGEGATTNGAVENAAREAAALGLEGKELVEHFGDHNLEYDEGAKQLVQDYKRSLS